MSDMDAWIDQACEQLTSEADALARLASDLDSSIRQALALILDCPGHVLVSGAGTSAAIAQRLAHLMSCCGTPALCISASDSLHGGAGAITANDVLYIISKGGRSAEVNALARIAHGRGATVIAQTEAPDSPLAELCDAVFYVDARQAPDPFGMIALGSSLIHAAAGDALCRALLIANNYTLDDFGKTHPGGAVGLKLDQSRGNTGGESA